MIDAMVKIAGSLFIGGIGLVMILVACLITGAFIRELIDKSREKYNKSKSEEREVK